MSVARAGEQRDDAFNPARQPDRDALAGLDPTACEVGGERVGGVQKLPIGEAAEPVADGEGLRRALGVALHQRIDRVVPPEARGLVLRDHVRRESRPQSAHAGRIACAGCEFNAGLLAQAECRSAVFDATLRGIVAG